VNRPATCAHKSASTNPGLGEKGRPADMTAHPIAAELPALSRTMFAEMIESLLK
jgi:hypothetical protein